MLRRPPVTQHPDSLDFVTRLESKPFCWWPAAIRPFQLLGRNQHTMPPTKKKRSSKILLLHWVPSEPNAYSKIGTRNVCHCVSCISGIERVAACSLAANVSPMKPFRKRSFHRSSWMVDLDGPRTKFFSHLVFYYPTRMYVSVPYYPTCSNFPHAHVQLQAHVPTAPNDPLLSVRKLK